MVVSCKNLGSIRVLSHIRLSLQVSRRQLFVIEEGGMSHSGMYGPL